MNGEAERYLNDLIDTAPLREPAMREAVRIMGVERGSRGLDAGCGIGLQALLLAQAVGPAGHVTGMDLRRDFVDRAQALAGEAGLSDRLDFQVGDIFRLPFADGSFDWVWSADCACYLAMDRPELIEELVRVLRRGGRLALLVWSSQMLLPGHPALESRLNATAPGIAPFSAGMGPESHYLRALGWLDACGLEDCSASTLACDVQAPLSEEVRRGMEALLRMRWEGARSEVPASTWEEYERLSRPSSPECLLRSGSYYGFFTYSLFQGTVPRDAA